MELAGIEIVFVERCAIRKNVFCLGNGLLADKVPAMGWNEIYDLKTDLYKGFGNRIDSDSDKSTDDALLHPYSYFVHSYYVPLCEETIAKAEYILPYSASLHKDNFYTCQFHPEKSGKVGEQILKNFLEIK